MNERKIWETKLRRVNSGIIWHRAAERREATEELPRLPMQTDRLHGVVADETKPGSRFWPRTFSCNDIQGNAVGPLTKTGRPNDFVMVSRGYPGFRATF
jgi:hypothetical protein